MSNQELKTLEASQLPATTPQAPEPQQDILAGDIVLPKLLLMQGLSEFVKTRKAQLGDIVRSNSQEVLAKPGERFDFIPLKITMGWAEKEKVGQDFAFRRAFPRTRQNEMLPWNFWRNAQGMDFDKPGQLGATEWKRVKSIDVYALLPRDVDAFQVEMANAIEKGEVPDLNKTVLPVVISFRSTGFKAGQAVVTFFAKVAELALSAPHIRSYDFCLSLGSATAKSGNKDWLIFDVGQAQKLDKKYRPHAEKWMAKLNSDPNIVVDESGDPDSEVAHEGGQY